MEIEKSRELGLCFGVSRAIKLLKEAAGKYGKIETLGPVAHNQQLVEELAEVGIRPVDELEQVKGKILAIPTHGVSPSELYEIEARHVRIIDTTCPIVSKAQNTAKELAEAGFDIIVFGEAEHSEVKGLLGWAKDKGIAALDVQQIAISSLLLRAEALTSNEAKGREHQNNLYRLGIISQTTQSWPAFVEFSRQFMAALPAKVEQLHIINTLCQATQRRREAAIELAKRIQLMIVVGGHNSANTKRLAEACSPIVETHLVERAREVDSSWLVGKQRVGITAGTSTPDEAIEEVVAKVKCF
jgi:4-hydroxy-3-methylbut-2-enyl diphosphate reductase